MKSAPDKDTILANACIAVLRRIDVPLTVLTLSRLCGADSSEIFRVLSNHPGVITKRSEEFTTFEVKP